MTTVATIIQQFKDKHGYTDKEIANLIADELKRRTLPPTDIARNTITYWRRGEKAPEPLMIEWLRDHAEYERVKELAGDMLQAMRG